MAALLISGARSRKLGLHLNSGRKRRGGAAQLAAQSGIILPPRADRCGCSLLADGDHVLDFVEKLRHQCFIEPAGEDLKSSVQ